MSNIESLRRAALLPPSDRGVAIAIATAFLKTTPRSKLERFEALIILAKNLLHGDTTEEFNKALRTADDAQRLLPKHTVTIGMVDAEMLAIAALGKLGNSAGRDIRLREFELRVSSRATQKVQEHFETVKKRLP